MRSYLPFTALVAVAIALLAAGIILRLTPPEPPLTYTQAEYTPERPVIEPGETLTYTPTLVINRAGRIDIVRSYWDVGRNQTGMLCDGSAAPSVSIARALPLSLHGALRQQPVRIELPNLRPGVYLLVSSATKPDGGEAGSQVRFRVTKRCDG